jgi:phosphosulfolactate phosphohydrolase-like enzyme
MSGRELIDRGFPQDVVLAVQLDVSTTAPRLRDGLYADGGVQSAGSK